MREELQFLKAGHRCRPGGNYAKTSITIHSTGNPKSTAQNERAWLDNPANDREASWHYVVGEDVVIQAIPEAEEAWHCGNRAGNRHSIGIELIESGDRKTVLETAAEFVADKVNGYGLSMDDIKKHYDWTGKNCPRILIDKAYIRDGMDWAYFLGRVEEYRRGVDNVDKQEERYQRIEELPEWAQPAIQQLVDKGKIADGNKLDLSMDMVRVLVILSR